MAARRPLPRFIVRPVRALLRLLDFDLVRLSSVAPTAATIRSQWIDRLGVDLVVDVGANEGQFVGWMRDRGYTGRIVSFEPQRRVFEICRARWKGDPRWTGFHRALGEESGEMQMHVAGNSVSSSLLTMLDSHVEALPESAIVATEAVTVSRLDETLGPEVLRNADRIYLKMDVQGFERNVLRGATGILDRIAFIELELSLVPLYSGQVLLPEMMNDVAALGFTPVALEPGFTSTLDGRMLQMDGLFVRTSLLDAPARSPDYQDISGHSRQ